MTCCVSSNSTVMGYTHLDVRKVRLECVGAGVSSVEEHELCFLQMAGRQALLGVGMRTVKETFFYTQTNTNPSPPHPFTNKKDIPPADR